MGSIPKIQEFGQLTHGCAHRFFLVTVFIGLIVVGCATTPLRKVDTDSVILDIAETELPESQLLDVQIEVFNPGELPESKEEARGLSEEIRKAEARYIPVHLKDTLQQSGYWGAVRVVPTRTPGGEVSVTGRILNSDGEILELDVDAYDATGAHWFNKTYKGVVDLDAYEKSVANQLEVFQDVYDQIANDLAKYRATLLPRRIRSIRRIAEMRFAVDFAPDRFEGYLERKDTTQTGQFQMPRFLTALAADIFKDHQQPEASGPYSIVRLPAKDDVTFERVRRIRERDYRLVDTLDSQYEMLYRDMSEKYTNWRKSRMTETEMIRELEQKANSERAEAIGILVVGAVLGAALDKNLNTNGSIAGATAGAAASVAVRKWEKAGDIEEQAEMNKVELEVVGESFGADVKPIVVEVEGETVELTGVAESKYQQWRDFLRRLHEREVGPLTPTTHAQDSEI